MNNVDTFSESKRTGEPREIGLQLMVISIAICILGMTAADDSFALEDPSLNTDKRSFFDIQCKGVYNRGILAKLNRICVDCYNLYNEPQVYSDCSQKCFSSEIFFGCLEALMLSDEEMKYREYIRIINGINPFEEPIDPLEIPH